MEGDVQVPSDLLPAVQLQVVEGEALAQLVAAVSGQDVQGVLGPSQHPGGQHVGVRVVVQAGPVRPGVGVVVLVGAEHAADRPVSEVPVVGGGRGPEAGDLQQRLGAGRGEEVPIPGGLVVLPDVVRDRRADVPLEVAVVRQPAAGQGVEVQLLGLLPAVARALPRVHRPAQPDLLGLPAGRVEAAVAVAEHGAGEFGEAEAEQPQDEQLIPEDVAAVGLPVQPAGRDADVQVDGVLGVGLEQVEQVQVQRADAVEVGLDPAAAPQLRPAHGVFGQQFLEGPGLGGEQPGGT